MISKHVEIKFSANGGQPVAAIVQNKCVLGFGDRRVMLNLKGIQQLQLRTLTPSKLVFRTYTLSFVGSVQDC